MMWWKLEGNLFGCTAGLTVSHAELGAFPGEILQRTSDWVGLRLEWKFVMKSGPFK